MRQRAALLRRLMLALWLSWLVLPAQAQPVRERDAFDHGHAAWQALLARHVVVLDGGRATRVRYHGFAAERAQLLQYLSGVSAVSRAQYQQWSRAQRLAFLINAYNAFTIEKVLSRYPDLKSMRDFGRVIGNPWRDRFFTLFGAPQHLDGIEHETIRAPGAFDDPRIHFVVNCAAIGCPALREEAYTAVKLEHQLEEQTARFLSDRRRNRHVPGALEVSQIFDWYGRDFSSGQRGIHSLQQFFAQHAQLLADRDEDRQAIRSGRLPIRFLEYDWALNDTGG